MAKPKVLLNCLYCNASFRVKPSHAPKRKYCSQECYFTYRRECYSVKFWNTVNKTENCWLWAGTTNQPSGYGVFHFGGKPHGAHRVAYELTYGTISGGFSVLHACDNPPCVRPDHLYAGTQLNNMRDRKERLRHQYGISHHKAVLNEDQVRDIRRLYAQDGLTQIALGQRFGVDNTTISMIVTNKTWRHLL